MPPMPPILPSVSKELRKRLRQARADLLDAVRARTGQQDGEAPAIGLLAQLAGHESSLLHEIDVAIGKLAAGGAGICESCGRGPSM